MNRSTPRPSSTRACSAYSGPCSPRIEHLELAERPDRAGDQHVSARDVARLAREAHGRRVDRLELVVEEPRPRACAGWRRTCSSRSARHRRGCSSHGRRRRSRARAGSPPRGSAARARAGEERAHAAVGHDRRAGAQPLEEVRHASSLGVSVSGVGSPDGVTRRLGRRVARSSADGDTKAPLDGADFVTAARARGRSAAHPGRLIDDGMRTRLTLPDARSVDAAACGSMVLHGGALLIVDAEDRPAARRHPPLPARRRGRVRLLARPGRAGAGSRPGARARADTVSRGLRPSGSSSGTTIGNEPSERVARRAGFKRVGPEPPIEYPGGRVIETNLWVGSPSPRLSALRRRRGRRDPPSRRRR